MKVAVVLKHCGEYDGYYCTVMGVYASLERAKEACQREQERFLAHRQPTQPHNYLLVLEWKLDDQGPEWTARGGTAWGLLHAMSYSVVEHEVMG